MDELVRSFETNGVNPYILNLRKHTVEEDSLNLTIDSYLLYSIFSRKVLQRGSVCTFVQKDQCFNKTDILYHSEKESFIICTNLMRN
jgi:hypothetical protein